MKINNNLYLRSKRTVSSALGSINTMAQFRGYNRIVGSQQQITQGLATHASIASAISGASDGYSIYILAGTYTENVLVNKQGLFITGQGYSTFINGTLTFDTAGDFSRMRDLRINGNITFNAGSQGCYVDGMQTAASTVTNNGTDNYYLLQDT